MSEAREPGRGQRVEILTNAHRLVGNIFVPETGGRSLRLSDVMNEAMRPFLPLVKVAMYRRSDDEFLMEQAFLLVNRNSIEILRPLD